MALDWWVELPVWVRALLLAVSLALLTYTLVRHVLVPVIWSPGDDEVALWVERAAPVFNNRLIASVQLTRAGALDAGASRALVRQTLVETEQMSAPLDFAAVVKPDRFVRWFAAATLVVFASGLGMLRGGSNAFDLLRRALLVPGVQVPRKTLVEVVEPRQLVARGDPVTLRARALGVIAERGHVEVFHADSQNPRRYSLDRDPAGKQRNEFALTIDNVQASFQYVVHLNDGHSETCQVEVADRPAAVDVRVRQIFPRYTGLPEQVRAPGDLSILAGSKLLIEVVANKNVSPSPGENRVHLHGPNQMDHPLAVDSDNAKLLRATGVSLPQGTTGMSVHLTDERGLTTKDPAVYRIDMVPDKPPSLRITSPAQREDLATRRAKVLVGIEASDDFGLSKLSLRYRIVSGDANVGGDASDKGAKTIQLDVPARSKSFRGFYPLRISELQPSSPMPGQMVEWWIECEDANDVTGPGRTVSDRYLCRVVTDEEKRAELMSRLGNYLGEINEVSDSQRDLSATLGQMITEKK
jgi:hypothetical protein